MTIPELLEQDTGYLISVIRNNPRWPKHFRFTDKEIEVLSKEIKRRNREAFNNDKELRKC